MASSGLCCLSRREFIRSGVIGSAVGTVVTAAETRWKLPSGRIALITPPAAVLRIQQVENAALLF